MDFENLPVQNFTPPTADSNNLNSPNLKNISGKEQLSSIQKMLVRSGKIRKATQSIKRARQQFTKFLKQQGLVLYTSAVEFQQTGDFILSSYVVYSNYNDYMEPLASFLQRYPFLQEQALAIRDSLTPIQNQMQVNSPRFSDLN